MADYFQGYKGGSFGGITASLMNAALQNQNRVPQWKYPGSGSSVSRSPVVPGESFSMRREQSPYLYQKFKDQTLGATLAEINDLRNLTETETVQIPIETPPPGGQVALDEYRRLQDHEGTLANMITDLSTQSNKLEKKIDSYPKEGMTDEQQQEAQGFSDQFNQAQKQKQEAEQTYAEVQEAIKSNILAGGGEPITEVHTAHREVPVDMATKREAAMKMVAAQGGRLGGIEMAKLYAEIDRLYPTERTATTHVDDQGRVIGWQPSGMNTILQKRPGVFDPNQFGLHDMEMTGFSQDQYGNRRYNYVPKETPKRKIIFPNAPVMYAATDESAANLNEMITDMPSMVRSIDRLLEIAHEVSWDQNAFARLDPVIRKEAQQLQTLLIGKIRVALVGPGVVSNFDYEQLQKAVDNPVEIFDMQNILSGGESSIKALNILKEQMNHSLIDKAAAAGLTTPGGKYKLPTKYRKFDNITQAGEYGFSVGDIVYVKGIPGRENIYTKIRIKPNQRAGGQ